MPLTSFFYWLPTSDYPTKKASLKREALISVQVGRLELPHLAALDPKSSVSTNSTTPATYVPKYSRNRDANINIPLNIQITCQRKFTSNFVLLNILKNNTQSITNN